MSLFLEKCRQKCRHFSRCPRLGFLHLVFHCATVCLTHTPRASGEGSQGKHSTSSSWFVHPLPAKSAPSCLFSIRVFIFLNLIGCWGRISGRAGSMWLKFFSRSKMPMTPPAPAQPPVSEPTAESASEPAPETASDIEERRWLPRPFPPAEVTEGNGDRDWELWASTIQGQGKPSNE